MTRRVCTDSRLLAPGDLFVALRGERYDGHDYLDAAAERGAVGAMVDSSAADNPGRLPLVVVDNTRLALGRLAASYRREFDPQMIAVGGSNGKTSTKDLLTTVLKQRWETLGSEASFNNDIGVPLTLLRLERRHQAAVCEVGTNHPGELAPLVHMVRPRIGVITSLGREHLEFFQDMTGVCLEEGALAEQLPAEGTLYFGADNAWGEAILRRTQATVVRVGFSEGCDWRVSDVHPSIQGTRFQVRAPIEDYSGEYRIRLLGRHQALNATFAIAVASGLGLTRAEIQEGLDEARPARGRMDLRRCGAIDVLDDSYNANADSMAAALQTLAQWPCRGTRVAVLGDMAELGAQAVSAHAEAGRLAAELDLGQLLVVGEHAAVTAAAARRAGLHRVLEFATVEALSDAARQLVHPGDLVLLKASRRVRIERVAGVWCDRTAVEAH
jgi:UDP-N-acetylmuramoyl-tripeptide--D-alanyl-D-alanine ligase